MNARRAGLLALSLHLLLPLIIGIEGCFPELPDEGDDVSADSRPRCSVAVCEAENRLCPGPDTTTTCGPCREGFHENENVCVADIPAPSDLTASQTLNDRVVLAWSPETGATGYRIYHCDLEVCVSADWQPTTDAIIRNNSYDDTTAPKPPAVNAPLVVASDDRVSEVEVSWQAVVIEPGATRRYAVTSVWDDGESARSPAVVGFRAGADFERYEVRRADGDWLPAESETSWIDEQPPPPTIKPGVVTASEGTNPQWVSVAITDVSSAPGAPVDYQVRLVTSQGPGTASAAATGASAALDEWTLEWQRSAGTTPEAFEVVAGQTGETWNDTAAPADGSPRFYRARIISPPAVDAFTEAVSGSRMPPPGMVGNVSATIDRGDAVVVTWNALPEAIGYHVYVNGQKKTTGDGIPNPTWTDFAAPAPTPTWGPRASLSSAMVGLCALQRPPSRRARAPSWPVASPALASRPKGARLLRNARESQEERRCG